MKSGIVEVYLHGTSVGYLMNGKKTGSATFRYHRDAEYSLSLSMPRDKDLNPEKTRDWFEALLPEGDRHALLSKHFVLTAVDYSGLLSEVGFECAGAITFGSKPDYSASKPGGVHLADVLPSLPSVHDGASDDSLRSTVAGFQNKITALRMGAQWTVPDAGGLTTHIIKPENPHWAGMVDAEAWAMELAGSVANAAATSIVKVGGVRALASERFDRIIYDGELFAVHQEDLCQALGLNMRHKYALPAGNPKVSPSYRKLAKLLTENSLNPERELRELAAQMTVTMLLGNTDAHAKNFGLIHDVDGRVSLSPMYDVVPVLHYLPKDTKMAMSINSIFRLDRIKFYDLVTEAESWGINGADADRLIRNAADTLADAVPAAEKKYPERPDGVLKMLRSHLLRFDIELGEDGAR